MTSVNPTLKMKFSTEISSDYCYSPLNCSITVITTSNQMNKFTVTIEIETYSDSPEDWISESLVDQLEDDETITSVTVNRHD